MQESKLYINVILETISKIEDSINKINKSEFLKNILLQDATLMRLQVIGENITKIPLKIKKKNKEMRWRKFERLRNLISHKYDSVDYEIIWSFIKDNLNELKLGVLSIR